jgi:syntaxin 8
MSYTAGDIGNAQQQTQLNLQRVDTQLDALLDITGNQRVLAGQIGTELTDQQKIMGNISDHMDRTNDGIVKTTEAVLEVKTAGSTWFAWILAILTLIAIICVWALWKKKK